MFSYVVAPISISSHACYARSNDVNKKKLGLLLSAASKDVCCILNTRYVNAVLIWNTLALKAQMEIRFLSLKRSFPKTMRSQQKKSNSLDLFEEGVCYRQQLIWSSITGNLNEKITLNKLATRIDGFNST